MFEPLDQQRFKERLLESFPSVYLTHISIIQGVALGILASNTFAYVKSVDLQEGHWVRFLPYSVISLILIITVSYEYTWFVGIFRWPPQIFDVALPFILGFSEIGPMFFFTEPQKWWFLTAIFCCSGALAYLNTLHNCKRDLFAGPYTRAYQLTRKAVTYDIWLAVSAAIVFTFAGIVTRLEVVLIPVAMAFPAFIMWKDQRFMAELHFIFASGPKATEDS